MQKKNRAVNSLSWWREKISRLWRHFSFLPVDFIVLVYNLILVVSVIVFRDRVANWPVHLAFNLCIIAFVLHLGRLGVNPANRFMKLVRRWYFLILLLFIYEQTGGLVFVYVPRWLDNGLALLEYSLFGVHPTLFLQDYNIPLLNEYFMFGYFTYFFLILIYSMSLFIRKMDYNLDLFVTTMTLTFLTCFIMFYFYPIAGPRFLFRDIYGGGLDGWLFVPLVDYVIKHGAAEGGSMPSSHTAVAVVILVHSWRYSRRLGYIFTPIVVGLVIGTFWGRFHYISDTIVGLAMAIICIIIGDWLVRKRKLGSAKFV
jgi:membrane-associated phospholipid phosphatase